ncbi:hypothetical protein [Halalkalibacterium ligniniphilum]|uniref:hypothetical protein n=1 Tax=Halalkalibacterium ligniniphilum TaxID=1134413 RepID=UPI0003485B36|nr:hypothetical protein [Halalkalibacterium ligniniphilum]
MQTLPNYDNWKLESPIEYSKELCKCGFCNTALHEGDEVIPYNDAFYCSEECYQEKLCRMNEPDYITLSEEVI